MTSITEIDQTLSESVYQKNLNLLKQGKRIILSTLLDGSAIVIYDGKKPQSITDPSLIDGLSRALSDFNLSNQS